MPAPIAKLSTEQLFRVLTLRDHITQVVVIGTILLGIAAAVIGAFAYLRKRSLMGDALAHATLPGIAMAFLLTASKDLEVLLVGGTVTGVLGVLAVLGISRASRLKEDAAIGIVLSVFFGAGLVLLSLIQSLDVGEKAGLSRFIYGTAAAMQERDAYLIGALAALVLVSTALLFKEYRLVCFDSSYAAAQGWPVTVIDLLMMSGVVLTTVIGLQSVGLILVVALLIIPPAAARFWTDGLVPMVVLAGAFGALSGWGGSTISAMTERMPTGAVIVTSAGALFFVSMLVAPRRGVLAAAVRRWRLRRNVAHQNLLRALAEYEADHERGAAAPLDALLRSRRGWTRSAAQRVVRQAARRGMVRQDSTGAVALTEDGRSSAGRLLRYHLLWEQYLLEFADVAPSFVHRDADEMEHLLSDDLVRELEETLATKRAERREGSAGSVPEGAP